MKQGLQLKFSQNLSLTPQLQQAIKLLQLSTLELNQEIDLLMQTNPLLERDDESDYDSNEVDNAADHSSAHTSITHQDFSEISDGFSQDNATQNGVTELNASTSDADEPAMIDYPVEFSDEYHAFSNGSLWDENTPPADDDSDFKRQDSLHINLKEHLLSQLTLMPLSERDQALTLWLVDSINDDGYLTVSLEALIEEIPSAPDLDISELHTALRLIQNLDPIGVGARNVNECLLLQLESLPPITPYLDLAKLIVKHYLAALGARDFAKLRKMLTCDEVALKNAQELIKRLNPRPGSAFSFIGTENYIQHEVIIKKVKGVWVASLNEAAIPKLKINQLYANILKDPLNSSSQYLQSQMQEAKWMIKNIQQRFSTILRVSQAITDRQRSFLEHGEVAMKPLVLREIAEALDLHESTISRVTANKYALTPRGLFELKYFFGSAVSANTGNTHSATAIRELIKQLIDQENPKKPYSDHQMTNLLLEKGVSVARRTVTKYRESLHLAAASLRKKL